MMVWPIQTIKTRQWSVALRWALEMSLKPNNVTVDSQRHFNDNSLNKNLKWIRDTSLSNRHTRYFIHVVIEMMNTDSTWLFIEERRWLSAMTKPSHMCQSKVFHLVEKVFLAVVWLFSIGYFNIFTTVVYVSICVFK